MSHSMSILRIYTAKISNYKHFEGYEHFLFGKTYLDILRMDDHGDALHAQGIGGAQNLGHREAALETLSFTADRPWPCLYSRARGNLIWAHIISNKRRQVKLNLPWGKRRHILGSWRHTCPRLSMCGGRTNCCACSTSRELVCAAVPGVYHWCASQHSLLLLTPRVRPWSLRCSETVLNL